MSFKNFGKLFICGALASVFIACGGGNDYKEFVADMDIEKRALERVKEMYPNSKIYDPVSFVGVAKGLRYDDDFKPVPNFNYRKYSLHDYKDEKRTSAYPNDYYYIKFIVEKEKDKFVYVGIGCPFTKDKPCISADKITHPNDDILYFGKKNIQEDLVFYTDDEKKKIKERHEQAEKMKKQLGL